MISPNLSGEVEPGAWSDFSEKYGNIPRIHGSVAKNPEEWFDGLT